MLYLRSWSEFIHKIKNIVHVALFSCLIAGCEDNVFVDKEKNNNWASWGYTESLLDSLAREYFDKWDVDSCIWANQEAIDVYRKSYGDSLNYVQAERYRRLWYLYKKKWFNKVAVQKLYTTLKYREQDGESNEKFLQSKLKTYIELADLYNKQIIEWDSVLSNIWENYAMQAINIAQELWDDNRLWIALLIQASIYTEWERTWSAELLYDQALQIFQELENNKQIADIYYNKSRLEASKNNYNQAIINMEVALDLIEDIQETPLEIHKQFLHQAVRLYIANNNIDIAKKYFNQSIQLQTQDIPLLADQETLRFLINNYTPTIFEENKRLQKLENKKSALRAEAESLEWEVIYETEKKDFQIKNQELVIEADQQKKNFLLWLAWFLTVLLAWWFVVWRKIAKQKKQVEKAKQEVEAKNSIIEEQEAAIRRQHKDLSEWVNAAAEVQALDLANARAILKQHLPSHFVFHSPHRPEYGVSGDFYRATHKDNKTYLVTGDCTGHGTRWFARSTMITMMLHQIFEDKVDDTGYVLDVVRQKLKLKNILHEKDKDGSEQESKMPDGMDATICCYDKESNELEFSWWNHSVYIIRPKSLQTNDDTSPDKEYECNEWKYLLLEYGGDRQAVGEHAIEKDFTTRKVILKPWDMVYTLSDGYQDQFWWLNEKKFMKKGLRDVLLSLWWKSPKEQKTIVEKAFYDRKWDIEQTDDVLVIGIQVPEK